ncbi:hemerythrin HHE cation binding domain-containing protein [Microdochium trichocladiopsis]|uniref:Hemerythrin HHE cation binding domain-containing protein n=1 Tax=Microdochium trichocladiopsis TaxID=1682393 RepID=A0A9P8XVF5_9PEZI|nr:hemerythrin HHE cation binding domain-containing protein [Microdochium trichocladiopsis]KAH7018610.1 hemerythrin HHE cation binding domain-containing protein [Microdochium trichocladiopsis]
MAPVYADHPYNLIPSPKARIPEGEIDDEVTQLSTEMVNVHNCIIRGLNSIYLQAPHIKPKDEKTFLNYVEQWYNLVHAHHSSEESHIFPILETMAGEKGIMDANIEQHQIFEKGVEALHTYIKACLIDQEAYDGAKVQKLVDGFGKDLFDHLRDEITTLMGLRRFGEERLQNLMARFAHVGKETMAKVGMLSGGLCVLTNHDVAYEGGLHRAFPPAPPVILWGLRSVGYWRHSDWWKYAACDRLGNLQSLYAIPA